MLRRSREDISSLPMPLGRLALKYSSAGALLGRPLALWWVAGCTNLPEPSRSYGFMNTSYSCLLCLVGCNDIFGHHLHFCVFPTGSIICTKDTFQLVYRSSFRLKQVVSPRTSANFSSSSPVHAPVQPTDPTQSLLSILGISCLARRQIFLLPFCQSANC